LAKVAYNYQMLAEVLLNYYGSDLYKTRTVRERVLNEHWPHQQGDWRHENLVKAAGGVRQHTDRTAQVVRMEMAAADFANATNLATAALFLPMGSLYAA
jgi:hypothetical protein